MTKARKDHEDELKQLRLELYRSVGRKDVSQEVNARSKSVMDYRGDLMSNPSVFGAKKLYSVDPITVQRTPRKGNPMNQAISVGTFNPPKRPQLLAPINMHEFRT